ncbi:MAG: dienelactone hydrolase family protein [Bacteroidetes bacterium]|nr:dienelactone hydrolase family protein [Bacteroidota bacterium]MBU1114755.1 dienelactone hydrolase family protein [Bacteroidota bacterium]MBU1797778.1 dienelactone hydrolase family protein [Bacteroidota bacterium]
MIQNYSLTSSLGGKIAVTTYGNENISQNKCIILVHGFKGFKDWGYAPYFGEYFANKGYLVITFNFSHNGIGENKFEFTEMEKFANNTFTLEIIELEDVIKAYQNNYFGEVQNPKIGLVGHSRGGAIALLTASKLENVKAISTWGSVSNLDRYSKRQKDIWRQKGYFSVMNMRTKQEMKLNISLLDDLEANKNGSLNIENAVSELNKPLLIIHGKEDLAVKISEAEEIYNWSNKEKSELILIDNTGHTFGCVHPFEGTNSKFNSVLEKTNSFFNKNLK